MIMINYFKKSVLFGVMLTGVLNVHGQADSTTYFKVQQLMDQAKKIYAPDKRLKLIEFAEADVLANKYVLQTTEPAVKEALRPQLAQLNVDFSIQILPDASVGTKIYGVVNLSVANLRTKPSHAAEMATQILMGAQVDILQKDGGDFRIRTPEGYIAWVPTSSIVAMDANELENWKASKKLIYTAEFGRSYTSANPKSLRISDLVYGDILKLTGEEGNYFKVEYPDKRSGYILKTEATAFDSWLKTRKATSETILSSAKSMMGLPYLWGGTSVKGVDCSGFTKTSFFMNGYVIPRDASQQVLHGDAVEILDSEGNFDPSLALKNLKPADLLFFAAGKNTSPNARVTHVALYIGEGTFIHAAGTVRINSMLKDAENYDDFQTRSVVAARRYIGSQDSAIQKIEENTYYTK